MKILIMALLILSTTGCIQQYRYQKFVANSIGQDGDYLIDKLGYPTRRELYNNKEYWIYEKKINALKTVYKAPLVLDKIGGISAYCITTFIFDGFLITEYDYHGDACYF